MKRLLLVLSIVVLAGCSIEIKEADENEKKEGFSYEPINEKKDKE